MSVLRSPLAVWATGEDKVLVEHRLLIQLQPRLTCCLNPEYRILCIESFLSIGLARESRNNQTHIPGIKKVRNYWKGSILKN